jgi:RimJ/RimL family protein N-acetyltransferase
MKNNIWHGEIVRLRGVEPEDWEILYQWNDDTESARQSYFIPFTPSRESMRKRAAEMAAADPKDDVYRWMIENRQGEVVGTLNTHSTDRRSGVFQYGVALKRAYWGKGYAAEAIRLVLAYYFGELGYQKVNVHIFAFNENSIRLHEKFGFLREGRLRQMIFSQGAYHDEVVMGMTVEEFHQKYTPNEQG